MEDTSRREILRTSGIAAGAIAFPNLVSATEKKPKNKLRIRRNISDPISPEELAERRREIIRESPDVRDGARSVRRSSVDLDANQHIVAYNFDIIDGAPSEWVGVARTDSDKHGKKEKKANPEKIVKNKADKNASARRNKKNNGNKGNNRGQK